MKQMVVSNENPWGHFQPVQIPSDVEEEGDSNCCDGQDIKLKKKKSKMQQNSDEDSDELDEKLNSYANQSEKFK